MFANYQLSLAFGPFDKFCRFTGTQRGHCYLL